MDKRFVYIVTKEGSNNYQLRYRYSLEKFLEDKKTAERLGLKLIRKFKISDDLVNPTIDLCSDFIKGRINLKDLDNQFNALNER